MNTNTNTNGIESSVFCVRSGFAMEDKRTGYGDVIIERQKFVADRAEADRLFDQWVAEDGQTEDHGSQWWFAVVEMVAVDEDGEDADVSIREFRSPAPQYWSAPSKVRQLQQHGGPSSWSIRMDYARQRWIAVPLNHYDEKRFASQPGGRTHGRALRACRRWLQREQISLD